MTALKLTFFDECASEPPKDWLIKGVIACGEDSTWYGPPGSLKSALLTDICAHIAAARDWRGHKVRRRVGAIYFALERAGLTKRRLAAYKVRDGLAGLPVAVVGDIIDLVDPGCVDIIVATVQAAEARFGIPVGLIVFDTYAKGIAAGGGDEDKAQHVNIVAANMKLVHERLGDLVHIATIGHSGKDETRGERGSNAKLGHVDLAVQISGDKVKTATVTKGNDQADGALTIFGAEEICIGTDEDGEPRTASIVSQEAIAAIVPVSKRTARQDLALNALDRLIRDHGQEPPAGLSIAPWVKVVRIETWRQELFRCGVIDRNAKNPWEPFRRLRRDLAASNDLVERDEYVWPAQPGGMVIPHMPAAPSIVPPGGNSIPPLPVYPSHLTHHIPYRDV